MADDSIYRSGQGEKVLKGIYDRQLADLDHEFNSRYIDTQFGKTHILISKEERSKKLLFFHGGNSTNPYLLKHFTGLFADFQIYSPDIIGHPGYSAPISLSVNDNSYGKWAEEVISELGFSQINCLGVSYGGGILTRLASTAPDKIEKGIFLVPSGIANTSLFSILFKLGLPMLKYRLFSSGKNLIKAIEPLTGDAEVDQATLDMIEAIFEHVRVKSEMPKNIKPVDMEDYTAPSLIIAAENDVLFPGEKVIKRARDIFTGPLDTFLLKEAPHFCFLNEDRSDRIVDLIDDFI